MLVSSFQDAPMYCMSDFVSCSFSTIPIYFITCILYVIHYIYIYYSNIFPEHDCLTYNIQSKTKLLESGLLNNGGVGSNDEVKEGERLDP